MSANNSISARTQRLNKLIVSCLDDSKNAGVANATTILNRETLLDAFNALYNECNKDAVKKGDTNIFEFTKKCKFFLFFGNCALNADHNSFCFVKRSRSGERNEKIACQHRRFSHKMFDWQRIFW